MKKTRIFIVRHTETIGNVEKRLAGIKDYEGAIVECANMELRQTVQNIRNSSENFQYELFKLAECKGYYSPAEPAKPDEIAKVHNECM